MDDIRIRKVNNGFIVYDTPTERFECTSGEYVFNEIKDLFAHIEKWNSPEAEGE